MHRRSLKLIGYGLLGLLLVGAACWMTPLRWLFDHAFLVHHFHRLGPYATIVFVAVFAVTTVLGFPGNVLAIAAGSVFGVGWGTLWSVIGATLGAVGAFGLARSLLHDWAERRFGHHPLLKRLKNAVLDHPLSFVLAVRFTPISPFNLVNFLFGLTKLHPVTYTIGTLVGIIPGTFAYVWVGAAGAAALEGGDRLSLIAALLLLSLLSGFPILQKQVQRHHRKHRALE